MSFGCAEEEGHGRNVVLEKISCPRRTFKTSETLTLCTRSEPSFRWGEQADRKATKQVGGWLLGHSLKLYKIQHQACACKLLQPWILSAQPAMEQYGRQPGLNEFRLFVSSGEA